MKDANKEYFKYIHKRLPIAMSKSEGERLFYYNNESIMNTGVAHSYMIMGDFDAKKQGTLL